MRFQVLLMLACLFSSLNVLAEDPTTNQLPNPFFRGDKGAVVNIGSTVTGTPPTQWRVFGVDGANINVEIVPLAANAIFAGSPATNAVRLTVTAFGTDQGFDDSPVRFSLMPDRTYQYKVYLKSENADNSDQDVAVGFAQFNLAGDFVGGLGSATETATTTWAEFTGPSFLSVGSLAAEMSFRLLNDDGDNSVLIALPEIVGPPVTNLTPNPGFEGTGGVAFGDVSGTVPDSWRGFAIDEGAITLATVPVAADELYPGSPPTNAVQLTVDTFVGSGQGFDHEVVRSPIIPSNQSIWGEVYLRTANVDSSPQGVLISFNAFSDTPAYIGGPPNVIATATTSWGYFGTFSYQNLDMATADMAFRLLESGPNNSVLIAMPRINGFASLLFEDGFEDP